MTRGTIERALGSVAILFVFAALNGSSALAAETHLFDATLSLTGNCKTSAVDPVPDPGCPAGSHPPAAFTNPQSVATDKFGDIYVASDESTSSQTKGRIDVFDAEGFFLTEIKLTSQLHSIAVDSNGNLYVHEPLDNATDRIHRLVRYEPSIYIPLSGQIAYDEPPVIVLENGHIGGGQVAMVVNLENDHLFINAGDEVLEYGSAEEGNPLLDSSIGAGTLHESTSGLAVDSSHGRIYASQLAGSPGGPRQGNIQIFALDSPHESLGSCDGSTTPSGRWGNNPTLAVDEETGNLFVYDVEGSNQVYELGADCELISTVSHSFNALLAPEPMIDNSAASPNQGYLFVPSHPSGTGHSFAFAPPTNLCPPEVESASFSDATVSEVELRAEIVPCDPATHYTFEYTPEAAFEKSGFGGALIGGGGLINPGTTAVEVFSDVGGLAPGTLYRFRVVAENECEDPSGCRSEAEGTFATYPEEQPPTACPNYLFRTGAAASLPDCRAFELVSPADTNGRGATGVGPFGAGLFPTRQAAPAGDRVSFVTEGGSIPGTEGTGSFGGDHYLASRTPSGWATTLAGPTGAETTSPSLGGTSSDQGYTFWEANGEGPAVLLEKPTFYVRYPDGHSALIGRGSIGSDPRATGRFISDGGTHIVFDSGSQAPAVRLENNSPPAGTKTIYDRTADEVTHVVSLLPGNVVPGAGNSAEYLGASFDGHGVAFSIAGTIYLRYDDTATYVVSNGGKFAGISEGGRRVFYVKNGNIFAYDASTEGTIPFAETGDATVVNVATAGTGVYFVSPTVLATGANPLGASPQAGKENLYFSREGSAAFVGTVTPRDVEGEFIIANYTEGLGLWLSALQESGKFGRDPSRTTPSGDVILFESRAQLSDYDPEGHAEIYRYDFAAQTLTCLSCNPTKAPAGGEASLFSETQEKPVTTPLSAYAYTMNIRADGQRAFFQSPEALVPYDTDGLQDVYQWEADGVGDCHRSPGCLGLISSGHSAHAEYLFGASESGDDVFIVSSALLFGADHDATPSIYDARVGGGFPDPEAATECTGETCRPDLAPSPSLSTPGIAPNSGSGNWRKKQCPKGKHKIRRHKRAVCVKHHQRRKTGSKAKGAGK